MTVAELEDVAYEAHVKLSFASRAWKNAGHRLYPWPVLLAQAQAWNPADNDASLARLLVEARTEFEAAYKAWQEALVRSASR